MSNDIEPLMAEPSEAVATSDVALHPIKGVFWATFFGSLLAGGVVLALNYRRLGQPAAAFKALVISTLALAGLMVGPFLFPALDELPNSPVIIAQLVIMVQTANSLQGSLIYDHRARGGTVVSAWRSLGVGLLCTPLALGVMLGAFFAAEFVWEASLGEVVRFEDDEIYYDGNVTSDDARTVARVLQDAGFIDGSGASIRILTEPDGFVVRVVMYHEFWNDQETRTELAEIGKQLIAEGIPGPVILQPCNDMFKPKSTVIARPDIPPNR